MTRVFPLSSVVSSCALAAAVVLAGTMPASCQSDSASFRLTRSTNDSAGGASSSASFRQDGSLGQESCVGASASPHFVVQSGFWSFAGTGFVPVYLYARKTAPSPDRIELEWTGNNPPYTVYRSADCAGVFSSVFASAQSNLLPDPAPLPDRLSCYNVLATAPGPRPPAGEVSPPVHAADSPPPASASPLHAPAASPLPAPAASPPATRLVPSALEQGPRPSGTNPPSLPTGISESPAKEQLDHGRGNAPTP
jgi:hypothetical protein